MVAETNLALDLDGQSRKYHAHFKSCVHSGGPLPCACNRDAGLVTGVANDVVNHPSHYKSTNGIEAVDVVEGFALDYHCGNVVTYVLRHAKKNGLEDLKKARWHLDREIANMEKTRV